MKEKRNNNDHPWKKAFSWKTVKEQKANKIEIDKIEEKHARENKVSQESHG
jgi:hypothetical protein